MTNKPPALSAEAVQVMTSKQGFENQLIFGFLILFFQKEGKFPTGQDRDCFSLIPHVAHSIGLCLEKELCLSILEKATNPSLRSIKRFKKEIRVFFQFEKFNKLKHLFSFIDYCILHIFPFFLKEDQIQALAYAYLKNQKIEAFHETQMNSLLKTAYHQFEKDLFLKVEACLSPQMKKALDNLIQEEAREVKEEAIASEQTVSSPPLTLGQLKEDKAHLKRESILYEVQKYKALNDLNIPPLIGFLGSRKLLEKYYDRVWVNSPSHLRNHKAPTRYAYLAIFCVLRQQQLSDVLTDLLLKLLQRLLTKAEQAVDRALLLDNKRVKGKLGTLLFLAKQSLLYPDGVIKETIYPEISKDRLSEIVTDLGEDGYWYRNQVKAKALSLYSHTNRKVIWMLIEALDFGSDPERSRFLRALSFLKKMKGKDASYLKQRLYTPLLLKRLIPHHWLSFVVLRTNDSAKVRIHWNALELALFERLKGELPLKNVWVKKAFRYRCPHEDMPPDFDAKSDFYFKVLGLPPEGESFIKDLKQTLDASLQAFNNSILTNPKVRIKKRKNKGAIKVIPFDPQSEPHTLERLKLMIAKIWPNVHLLDLLKEADFRVGFSKIFKSFASREAINEDILSKRLLLCLFGLGSNTGLKRMSGLGDHQESYNSLRYVKRRFINGQNVRLAIQSVVNAIQQIREPHLWGHGTTSCAADSKKMSVWDQNLLVEWHARYGGRGVMIYWHVDKKGLCVHSMLKTCSSSEVGSMIHGLLHHDTVMDMNEMSVDTHGQSCIGFAFSELFGFDLLPRIKNIHQQKLYCSSRSKKESYPHLTDALATDTIGWHKIRQSYKEVVRHGAALKMRTVEPEVMMKRLSADNKSNPVYQALTEIGKASRTIFLCRYLSFEGLRRDISESLNVVERVNGMMRFIFYGRLGEISTNDVNDQELSLLCLHLLQVCLVYMNTLFIQTILSDPQWLKILTVEDMRALSPLFHTHINPYGALSLDMNTRLSIETHLYREKSL